MVLDSKIQAVKDYLGVESLDDWRRIEPHWITAIDGVGPVTLDHIRMYLAAKNIALKKDQTPEYWREHLSESRICHTMGTGDRADVAPFTVLIDTREQKPFAFRDIKGDAKDNKRPVIVPTRIATLDTGDYSMAGFESKIRIERKSAADLYGSMGRNHDRFEREIERLNHFEWATVVVESDWRDLTLRPPEHSKLSPKTISRTILAWKIRYPRVHWDLMPGRPVAENWTFRLLERVWKETEKQHKAQQKERAASDELF